MQLIYSNCVPKLTYGAAVKDYNASEKNQRNVAVNNAESLVFVYGKVFARFVNTTDLMQSR